MLLFKLDVGLVGSSFELGALHRSHRILKILSLFLVTHLQIEAIVFFGIRPCSSMGLDLPTEGLVFNFLL